MKRIIAAVLLALAVTTLPASAQERACETRTWTVDPGKTPVGFYASATDGCHTYEWQSTIGQGPAKGELVFHIGQELPSAAGGAANYCAYRAAHEASLAFTHYFQVADGTEIRVQYECE